MTTLYAGTAGFSVPRQKYARKLRFLEMPLRSPLPQQKTLARWREELGKDFVFSVVAPAELWGERELSLRDAARTQVETDRLANVLGHLKPAALLLRTPADVRPGSAAYRRFREWLPRWAKMAPVVAWEPYGLWEREAALEAVAGTGVLVTADPLRDDVSGEKRVYARMKGLGGDRRYHEGKLEDLGAALAKASLAYVVFETPSGFTEAVKLQVLAEGGLATLARAPEGPVLEGFDDDLDEGDDEDGEDDDEDEDDDEALAEGDDDGLDEDDGDEADEDFEDDDDSEDDDSEDDEDFEDEDEDGLEEEPAPEPPAKAPKAAPAKPAKKK